MADSTIKLQHNLLNTSSYALTSFKQSRIRQYRGRESLQKVNTDGDSAMLSVVQLNTHTGCIYMYIYREFIVTGWPANS